MDEHVLVSKGAGALVRQSEFVPSPRVELALVGMGGLPFGTNAVIEWFRQFHGGLWVGGRATLTDHRLQFVANQLNRMVHSGPLDVAVALPEIVAVSVRSAWVTNIVVVTLPGAELWLRCYGAGAFAEQIRVAVSGYRRA